MLTLNSLKQLFRYFLWVKNGAICQKHSQPAMAGEQCLTLGLTGHRRSFYYHHWIKYS